MRVPDVEPRHSTSAVAAPILDCAMSDAGMLSALYAGLSVLLDKLEHERAEFGTYPDDCELRLLATMEFERQAIKMVIASLDLPHSMARHAASGIHKVGPAHLR